VVRVCARGSALSGTTRARRCANRVITIIQVTAAIATIADRPTTRRRPQGCEHHALTANWGRAFSRMCGALLEWPFLRANAFEQCALRCW